MKKPVEIESQWDNIWDVFPSEMEQFQSYLDSKNGIESPWVDILGLKNPEVDLCLDFSYQITYKNYKSVIEVQFMKENILGARIIKKDGEVFSLSKKELLDVENDCKKSDYPFVHTMLDQVTLRLVEAIIAY